MKLCQQTSSGNLHHEFQLIFRKTNKDPTKGEDQYSIVKMIVTALIHDLVGQTYLIPPNATNSEIDCYTHLLNWVMHQQGLISRPLEGSDFVFPAIASTGQIKFGEPTSRTGFETLMDNIVQKSGVMKGRNGKFTTHCFRRGGAQYRFMYAPRMWSLKAVKWWGGWSSSDNVSHRYNLSCCTQQWNR